MPHSTAVSQAVHNASRYNDYTLPSRATLWMLFADSLVLSAGFSGMSEDESTDQLTNRQFDRQTDKLTDR